MLKTESRTQSLVTGREVHWDGLKGRDGNTPDVSARMVSFILGRRTVEPTTDFIGVVPSAPYLEVPVPSAGHQIPSEAKVGLTHHHESNTLPLWLNGCKSSSRILNTGKYSGLRDHGICLWRSGFARRWSPHAGRSRWAVQARSLTQFGSRWSTNIPLETFKTCLLKSKQAMERARARDFR
jgi:hypothetical protein